MDEWQFQRMLLECGIPGHAAQWRSWCSSELCWRDMCVEQEDQQRNMVVRVTLMPWRDPPPMVDRGPANGADMCVHSSCERMISCFSANHPSQGGQCNIGNKCLGGSSLKETSHPQISQEFLLLSMSTLLRC